MWTFGRYHWVYRKKSLELAARWHTGCMACARLSAPSIELSLDKTRQEGVLCTYKNSRGILCSGEALDRLTCLVSSCFTENAVFGFGVLAFWKKNRAPKNDRIKLLLLCQLNALFTVYVLMRAAAVCAAAAAAAELLLLAASCC